MTAIVYMGQRFEVDPSIDVSTFRWAAADDDGSLYIYSKAPKRERHMWAATRTNVANCPPDVHFVAQLDKNLLGSVPYGLIGIKAALAAATTEQKREVSYYSTVIQLPELAFVSCDGDRIRYLCADPSGRVYAFVSPPKLNPRNRQWMQGDGSDHPLDCTQVGDVFALPCVLFRAFDMHTGRYLPYPNEKELPVGFTVRAPEDIFWALDTVNSIEYSGDGFVKRYPDETKFKRAIAVLEFHINSIQNKA